MLGLIDTGIRSIRNVTNDLRPSLLDDLGLLPALRSLVADFAQRSGIRIELNAPAVMPPLSREAELALFRALQEGLSNVLRHAGARSVDVAHNALAGDEVQLRVSDDGRGPPDLSPERLELAGHMGLAGMRERITALGGTVRFHGRAEHRSAAGNRGATPPVGWRMTSKPIRVLVADDHMIVRTGIRHVLESEPDFEVVGEAASGSEALSLAAGCGRTWSCWTSPCLAVGPGGGGQAPQHRRARPRSADS